MTKSSVDRNNYPKFSIADICRKISYPSTSTGSFSAINLIGSGISIQFRMTLKKETGHLELSYTLGGRPYQQNIQLKLVKWNMNYWRVVCPLMKRDKPCGKLCKNVYLARFEYFGCAQCNKIYYEKISELNIDFNSIKEKMRRANKIGEIVTFLGAYLQFLKTARFFISAKNPEFLRRKAKQFAKKYGLPIRTVDEKLMSSVLDRYIPSVQDPGVEDPVVEEEDRVFCGLINSKLATASSKR